MEIYQAGGFTTNYAGDAGAIVGSSWVAVIDLGRKHSANATQPAGRVIAFVKDHLTDDRKQDTIITHYHEDHGQTDRNARGLLLSLFRSKGTLYDFPHSGRKVAESNRQGVINGFKKTETISANMYAIEGTLERPKEGEKFTEMLATLSASRIPNKTGPEAETKSDTDENKYSGGVYAETRLGSRPILGFLSLGDMDKDTGAQGIKEVRDNFFGKQEFYPKVLVIKLPHHGSGENFSSPLQDLIEEASKGKNAQKTRVYALASGHSYGTNSQQKDGIHLALEAGAAAAFVLIGHDENDETRLNVINNLEAMWTAHLGQIRILPAAHIISGDNSQVKLLGRTLGRSSKGIERSAQETFNLDADWVPHGHSFVMDSKEHEESAKSRTTRLETRNARAITNVNRPAVQQSDSPVRKRGRTI